MAARIVAITVATHPAAGVVRRSDQSGLRGRKGMVVELAPGLSGSCFSMEALIVVSCSRGSLASLVVSLYAFAVSITSESSGLAAVQKPRCTFARAPGEDVQRKTLENCSRLWL